MQMGKRQKLSALTQKLESALKIDFTRAEDEASRPARLAALLHLCTHFCAFIGFSIEFSSSFSLFLSVVETVMLAACFWHFTRICVCVCCQTSLFVFCCCFFLHSHWGCIKFELAFLNNPLPLTCRASLKTEMRWWITRRQQIESSSLSSPLFSFSFFRKLSAT